MNIPKYLIIHHTGGSASNPLADSSNFTFDQCNALHKVNFNSISSLGFYVGYHYYISKDGTIKQARADTDRGAHTINYNSQSLGICLAGNFDATLPTEAQIKTLTAWLKEKSAQYNITKENIFPHRKFAIKTCYGMRLADDWARSLLQDDMLDLRRGDGSSDTFLIDPKTGLATLFITGPVLELVSSFTIVKVIPQADMDAIPKSGKGLGLVDVDYN